jgi:hypothetical protein
MQLSRQINGFLLQQLPCRIAAATGSVSGLLHGDVRHNTGSASAPASASLDPHEAAKFAALSASWWDPSGPFAPLHRLNPARCKFIRDAVCSAHGIPRHTPEPLLGMHVLDVGCGGGILAESMARLGARVHAIDVTEENVAAAARHAALDPLICSRVRWGTRHRRHVGGGATSPQREGPQKP